MIELNTFSLFLNSDEPFIRFNPDILGSNVINIGILLGLLVYAYKISFSATLKLRQEEIVQTIENAQRDVVNASNYYTLAEKGFTQSLFWLQSWKQSYEKEKIEVVNIKYETVKSGFIDVFSTTETLISNFENRTFLSLQRYIVFTAASRILRKFFFLSEKEQSKLIELTISKLGEFKR